MSTYPFLLAKNFTPRAERKVTCVVIHTMEAPEGPRTAENIAGWFQNQPKRGELASKAGAPLSAEAGGTPWGGTSIHYNVDADSVVQSVHEKDIAWHAGPVNDFSIGVEHAGYARQTEKEWQDPYSIAMLEQSAKLVADICLRWTIPVLKLGAISLSSGLRSGICGHSDVTFGLEQGRGHTDPGPFFPWNWYLVRVRAYQAGEALALPPPLNDTRELQAALVSLHYDPGPIDGIEGPRTRASLKAFQRDHGLVVDGIFGPKTRAALRAVFE